MAQLNTAKNQRINKYVDVLANQRNLDTYLNNSELCGKFNLAVLRYLMQSGFALLHWVVPINVADTARELGIAPDVVAGAIVKMKELGIIIPAYKAATDLFLIPDLKDFVIPGVDPRVDYSSDGYLDPKDICEVFCDVDELESTHNLD